MGYELPAPVRLSVVAGSASAGPTVLELLRDAGSVGVAAPATLRVEPGSLCVVPDIAERTEGSPCCRSRLDVIDAVERLVCRRDRPDEVVVGVDLDDDKGGGDVATVVQSVLSDPDLQRLVRLERVAVAVDVVQLATRLNVGLPFASPGMLDALALTDDVVLNGADRVVPASRQAVAAAIRRVSRLGEFAADPRRLVASPERRDAWHGPPRVAPGTDGACGSFAGEGIIDDDWPGTVVLEQQGVLDGDAVEAWLDDVIRGNARRLLRLQGVFRVADETARLCCHGVHSFAMSQTEAIEASDSDRSLSRVVLVGRGLDAAELSDTFRLTFVDR